MSRRNSNSRRNARNGPARMRPHRALAAALARFLRECRTEVDIDRTVPELIRVAPNGAVQEAVLDLVVTFPGSVQLLCIDVSIRCPHAQRYGQAAASPGEAADAAIADKRALRQRRAHGGGGIIWAACWRRASSPGSHCRACRGVPPRPLGCSQTRPSVAGLSGTRGQLLCGGHRPARPRLRANCI